MALPSILLLLAVCAAGMMAYGTDGGWASFHHGIEFIVWSRRLQWPLAAAALLLCLVIAALVIAGRRRAWWLVGLLPVLALFVHRFVTGPLAGARVVEDPPSLTSTQASFLHDSDEVVGLQLGDAALAYPCALLHDAPAVVQNQRKLRALLLWSPVAHLATAYTVGRDLSARDLDIVSTPNGALLLYDQRLGQFINGITDETLAHTKPMEFHQPLMPIITTWAQWRQQNPQTLVLSPQPARAALWPHRLQWTEYAPADSGASGAGSPTVRRVCVVRTEPPIAVYAAAVTDVPLNLSAGTAAVVLLRDLASGEVRAFDRHVEADLIPRFASAVGANHVNAAMIDLDTGTEWNAGGVSLAASGPMHGKTLTPLPIAQSADLAVLQFWYPAMKLVEGPALAAAIQQAPPPGAAEGSSARQQNRATRRRRRRAAN